MMDVPEVGMEEEIVDVDGSTSNNQSPVESACHVLAIIIIINSLNL